MSTHTQEKTFVIPNISCEHCVKAIEDELSRIDGVSRVVGDSEKKSIAVEWGMPANLDQIKETLREINYPAED
ncbi:MAG: cation transporter [Spirochaetota bacterium]|nr:cation transporter [Spirochaetota bacterium]